MPGGMWTKMGSAESWQESAEEYYRDGLKITDIEALLDVSRKSISAYLRSLPDHEQIKEQRKRVSAGKRRQYKTEKQKQYRQKAGGIHAVTSETMKREHELAVIELSREKYH